MGFPLYIHNFVTFFHVGAQFAMFCNSEVKFCGNKIYDIVKFYVGGDTIKQIIYQWNLEILKVSYHYSSTK